VELAPAFGPHLPDDSASKLDALQTLRVAAHPQALSRLANKFALPRPAVQPRQAHTWTAVEPAKSSDNHYLSIRLWHHPADNFAGAFAGIKVRVQAAVWLQPGDPVAWHAIDTRKHAANQELPIRLPGNATDAGVGSRARIEGHVHASVWIEPGDSIAFRLVDAVEIAAHHNLAVGLKRHGKD
jgi:translation initiation factor IF-1